jgi:hypothetical protein
VSATPISPSQMLRSAIESAGFTVEGLPDDLTNEQVGNLAAELLRAMTHWSSSDLLRA